MALSPLSVAPSTPGQANAQQFAELRREIAQIQRTGLPAVEPFTAPTLTGGWLDFGSGANPAGYCIDLMGFVHLRGKIKSGAISSACFTLPEGYRPAYLETFAVASNGAYGQVTVSAAGVVTPTVGSTTWLSLDGITFRKA